MRKREESGHGRTFVDRYFKVIDRYRRGIIAGWAVIGAEVLMTNASNGFRAAGFFSIGQPRPNGRESLPGGSSPFARSRRVACSRAYLPSRGRGSFAGARA